MRLWKVAFALIAVAILCAYPGKWVLRAIVDNSTNLSMQHDPSVLADPGYETVSIDTEPPLVRELLAARWLDGYTIPDKVKLLCAPFAAMTDQIPGRFESRETVFGETHVSWTINCGANASRILVFKRSPEGRWNIASGDALGMQLID